MTTYSRFFTVNIGRVCTSQVLVAYVVPGVPSREKQTWFHVLDTFSLRKRSTMLSAGDIAPRPVVGSGNNYGGTGYSNSYIPYSYVPYVAPVKKDEFATEVAADPDDQVLKYSYYFVTCLYCCN